MFLPFLLFLAFSAFLLFFAFLAFLLFVAILVFLAVLHLARHILISPGPFPRLITNRPPPDRLPPSWARIAAGNVRA